MRKEEAGEPILTKAELLFVLKAIRNNLYTEHEPDLFVEIIYKGWEDPCSYDEVYAAFLLNFFAGQPFAAESASQVLEQKIFANMYNDRESDEAYHTGVLEWNISNLGLKLYADGVEQVSFALTSFCRNYGIEVSGILPGETFEGFLLRVNNKELALAGKTLLRSQHLFEFLLCDKDKVEKVTGILNKIHWNFHSLKT